MAEIQDINTLGESELDVVAADIDAKKAAETLATDTDEEVPEEFRGKSKAEIARIAQHARREMGRQGNELGEVRRLTDELLKSQLLKQPEPEKTKEVDFFENPQEAIRQAIDTNPTVVAAAQAAENNRRVSNKQQLVQLHPDFQQIVPSEEFMTWVKSSKIRTQLFNQAESYDVEAAHELDRKSVV